MKDFAVKNCHSILRILSIICISFAFGYYAHSVTSCTIAMPTTIPTTIPPTIPIEDYSPPIAADTVDSGLADYYGEDFTSESVTNPVDSLVTEGTPDSPGFEIISKPDEVYDDNSPNTIDTQALESPRPDTAEVILDDTPPIAKEDILLPVGSLGRISLPELGYSARLSSQSDTNDNGQGIVDEADHALLCNLCPNKLYGGLDVVADHSSQGFDVIKRAHPFETHCFITDRYGTTTSYVCIGVLSGHNDGYCITGEDNQMLEGNSNMLALYTCNENWQNITVVLFEKCFEGFF